MADRSFTEMMSGYSLTTAEILYRLPDHPALLQSYIWQDYDQHPRFPKLKGFLEFLEPRVGRQAVQGARGAYQADPPS